jgi:hypothetical protein
MGKQQIGAREVVNDVKSGMTDAELGKKYGLSPKGLESLFRKLVAAKLLDESYVLKRSAAEAAGGLKRAAAEAAEKAQKPSPAPSSVAAPSQPAKGQAQLSEKALAVAQDIRDGKHDAEIMRVHELSPGMLNRIRSELVDAGVLAAPSVGSPEGGPTAPCPFCGREIEESASECVYCGRLLQSGPSEDMAAPPTPPRPFSGTRHEEESDDDDKECAWENREAYGTLNAYFQTATKCLLTPTRFFQKLPLTDGYLNPVLFAAMSVPVVIVMGYIALSLFSGFRSGGGLIGLVLSVSCGFVAALIVLPIAIGIWSGILHLCLMLVGGANEGYQASFRVVAYSSVTNLFGVIPIVGNLASLWGIVLHVIGLRETHKTTTGKAVLAVAIPTGVIMLLGIIIAITGAVTLGKALNKGVPTQACASVETYIARLDSAANLDAELIENEVNAAANDLIRELQPFRGNMKVAVMQAQAMMLGSAVVQRNKGSKESIKTVGQLREALRQSCRK